MIGRSMVLGLVAVALGACAPARRAVPKPLSDTPRLAVKGRQGDQRSPTLAFGAWRVRDVRRSWVKGSGLTVSGGAVGLDLDRATQRYTFSAREADAAAWAGDCRLVYRHDGVVLPFGTLATDEQARLECTFAADGNEPWTLVARQRFDRVPEGVLWRGQDTLRVSGVDRFTNAVATRGLLAGWVIVSGTTPVAAVEVANDGAVWFGSPVPADRRPVLGATVSALLLHEDIRVVVVERPGGV